jgi:hypothetical protein
MCATPTQFQVAVSLRWDHVTSSGRTVSSAGQPGRATPYTPRTIVLVSAVQREEDMLGPIWRGVQLSSGDFMFGRNAASGPVHL